MTCSKDLSNRPIYAVLNTQLRYAEVMNPARIASSDEFVEMLYSVIRLIFKTISVNPDIFYAFNLILSFSAVKV